jgi:hypothetical protein
MADTSVKMTIAGDEKDGLRALAALERKYDKLEAKLRAVSQQSKKGLADSKRMAAGSAGALNQAATSALSYAKSFVGIGAAIGLARAAFDKFVETQERSVRLARLQQQLGAGVGGGFEKLRFNFLADQSVKTEQELADRLKKIGEQRAVKPDALFNVVGTALSTKGDLTNAESLKIVDTIAQLTNDQELLTNIVGGVQFVSQQSGEKDARKVFGFMRQTQVRAALSSPAKLASLLPRVIGAEKELGGGTAETAAELLATLSILTADTEGEIATTAAINLAKGLATFDPKRSFQVKGGKKLTVPQKQIDEFLAAKTTNERLKLLQQSPELGQQFLATANLGKGQALGGISQLVKADPAALKLLQGVRQDILSPTDPSQIGRFEKFRKGRAEAPFATAKRFQDIEEEVETGLLPDDTSRDARIGRAKASLNKVFGDVTDLPGIDRFAETRIRKAFDHAVAGKTALSTPFGRDPAAREELNRAALAGDPEAIAAALLKHIEKNVDTEAEKIEVRKARVVQERMLEELQKFNKQKPRPNRNANGE